MTLHHSTFQYIKPTDEQMTTMSEARHAAAAYAAFLEMKLPSGPDKTYVLRKLREVAMCNICITETATENPGRNRWLP
jgi:hypothetical protein